MKSQDRRYDIDWVRVIAIGLLLIYHTAIGFQSWGRKIGFITTETPWSSLWTPMAMLNVWRIPLLFFVSGMGVYFAIQNRNWHQLIAERASRILLPFLFGMALIVPAGIYIWQYYYSQDFAYSFSPGHLWFLGNIFLYVLILSPVFFYLKNNESGNVALYVKRTLGSPLGLLLMVAAFVLETLFLEPAAYELFAVTWHGFFLGMIAFLFGFCFVYSGNEFWKMAINCRWPFLATGLILYTFRITEFTASSPAYLPAIESASWVLAVFGFASKYLNHPSSTLNYLSQAAYPVYILHMIFLYLGSLIIFPTSLSVQLQYVFVLLFTFTGCFGMYELIKRIPYLRPLFGFKFPGKKSR
jgi:peptidoglycan/LPS O-acetylase OafA/YrhL